MNSAHSPISSRSRVLNAFYDPRLARLRGGNIPDTEIVHSTRRFLAGRVARPARYHLFRLAHRYEFTAGRDRKVAGA